jgi:hypothetical protein
MVRLPKLSTFRVAYAYSESLCVYPMFELFEYSEPEPIPETEEKFELLENQQPKNSR